MNRKLSEKDRKILRSRFANKIWELGRHLLEFDVRGDDFDYIMQGGETVDCHSKRQRQEWLSGAMDRMDERLPELLVKELREASACCLGGERRQLAQEIHDACRTVDERFEALSKARLIIGDKAWKTQDGAYRITFEENFPEGGHCACLRHVPETKPMSKSWCACCGGHIRHHFETALGVKAECTCISSALSSCGKEPCLFELRTAAE